MAKKKRPKKPTLTQIRGEQTEARVRHVLEELQNENLIDRFIQYEWGSLGDCAGYDFHVYKDNIPYGIQVKSSDSGVRRFHNKFISRGLRLNILVINGRLPLDKIKEMVLNRIYEPEEFFQA